MEKKDYSQLVQTGVKRFKDDFGLGLTELGFASAGRSSWQRPNGKLIAQIHFSRGNRPPINHSVWIDLEFQVLGLADDNPFLNSSHLQNSRGYHYHNRFNASSWSTYELCVDEMLQLVQEHAIPWFARYGV